MPLTATYEPLHPLIARIFRTNTYKTELSGSF